MATLDVTVWTMSWDNQKAQSDFMYFIALDTLTKPQWEAAVRGWGQAWFWCDMTVTGRPLGPRRLLLKHIYNIFTREDKISK